jgi:hypothetical protein
MPSDYAGAAMRHYIDAERLALLGRYDNAGHLIGFAAECALKKAARPFYSGSPTELEGHLPHDLKGRVKRELEGRNAKGQLLQLVAHNSNFFSDWNINDRYSADGHVDAVRFRNWLTQTRRIFAIAKLRSPP